MAGRTLTLLYLDSDYRIRLDSPDLTGINMQVIPEVRMSRPNWELPEGIFIRHDLALNARGDSDSAYEPTKEVLEKIRNLTSSGLIDLVVIGNNLGAGVAKAKHVDHSLRNRTIITANNWPPAGDYTLLGYSCFISRGKLAAHLLELVATIRSS